MPDPQEPFTPQFVDEQIEHFTPRPGQKRQNSTPEEELLMDIHDLYREYAGTRDRVRRRLQEQMEHRSRAAQAERGTVRSLPLAQQPARRKKTMYAAESFSMKTRSTKPRLALIAALVVALLVIALAVLGPFMRLHATQPNTPAQGHTPMPPQTVTGTRTPPASHQAGGLYITNSSGILRLDPNTGTTLQTYPWPNKGIYHTGGTINPYTLQVSGKLLFVGFRLLNSNGQLIYGGVQAFDTSKGQMLWEFDGTTSYNTALTIVNGTVYISVDHPDLTNRSLVFALRATDGQQLTSYDIPLGIQHLTVADGFLYSIGYESFYGVNLATKATWHIPGPQGAGVGFSDLHVVNNVLYVALYNGTGSVILALNPATGHELWRTQTFKGRIHYFTIVQNIAYFGMDQQQVGVAGTIGRFDAYDLSQHKLLWEVSADLPALTYAVANGMVYAVIQSQAAGGMVPSHLIALDARNGHQRWNITAGVVDVYQLNAPVIAPNGHIYIASDTPSTTTDDYSQYIGRHMEEIDQTSGNAIWNVSFSSEIGGYVLVS